MLDTDAPRPRDAKPADMRNLAADLLEAAEAILRKAPGASGEDLRKIMLGNIDAFCRFIDNSQAVADAVVPQLRELVGAAMADVRATMRAAIAAALGKEIRDVRPVEIKRYLQGMDLTKDAAAAAAMAKVAQAFAKLADASAAPLQAYVNEVCNLDPKAQIASEYDKMSPAQITESLSGKTLDDILDDPVTNSTRPGMLSFQKKVLSTYFTNVSHERKAGVLSSARPSSPARTTTSSARSWPKPPTGSSAPSPTASSRSTWPSTKSSTRRRPATTTSRPRRPPKSSPTSSRRTSTPSRSPSRASSARAGSPSPSRTPRRTT